MNDGPNPSTPAEAPGEVAVLLCEIRDRLPPAQPASRRRLQDFMKMAELLALIGLFLAMITFWVDYADRVEERAVRAWQLLTTPAPGNSGKGPALEYLNGEEIPLRGIDLSLPHKTPDDPNDTPPGVYLQGVSLPGADLFEADLSHAILSQANLSGANLDGANLSYADLIAADLSAAKLTGANLSGANLINANLSDADLINANLLGAELANADLSDADLINANLSGIDLAGVNLSGANLAGANLLGADLDYACGDTSTRLPEGVTIPQVCPPPGG